VRKAEKQHGTDSALKASRESARVVIVDDVCTTGASPYMRSSCPRIGFWWLVMCLVDARRLREDRAWRSRGSGVFRFDFHRE